MAMAARGLLRRDLEAIRKRVIIQSALKDDAPVPVAPGSDAVRLCEHRIEGRIGEGSQDLGVIPGVVQALGASGVSVERGEEAAVGMHQFARNEVESLNCNLFR